MSSWARLSFSYASQLFAVPFGIVICVCCTSLVLISTLRMLFPPILSGPSVAAIPNEPRSWQKPNLIPARAISQRALRRIVRVQPRPGLKTGAALSAGLFVAGLLGLTLLGVTKAIKPQFVVAALIVLLVIYQIQNRE